MSISSRMLADGLKTVNRASESRLTSNQIFRKARAAAIADGKRSTVNDLMRVYVDLRDETKIEVA